MGKVDFTLSGALMSRAGALARLAHTTAAAVRLSRLFVFSSSLVAVAVLSRLLTTRASSFLGTDTDVTGFLAASHFRS